MLESENESKPEPEPEARPTAARWPAAGWPAGRRTAEARPAAAGWAAGWSAEPLTLYDREMETPPRGGVFIFPRPLLASRACSHMLVV